MFLGIDVTRFMPLDDFVGRMQKLAELIKSTPPAKGYTEVLLAGEPEWRMEEERRASSLDRLD